eukprot:SAG31_NODE_3513_length_4171_cov_2.135527_7_plen_170_part_00
MATDSCTKFKFKFSMLRLQPCQSRRPRSRCAASAGYSRRSCTLGSGPRRAALMDVVAAPGANAIATAGGGTEVQMALHPLVILNISDHYTRQKYARRLAPRIRPTPTPSAPSLCSSAPLLLCWRSHLCSQPLRARVPFFQQQAHPQEPHATLELACLDAIRARSHAPTA